MLNKSLTAAAPLRHNVSPGRLHPPLALTGRRTTMYLLPLGALLYACGAAVVWLFNRFEGNSEDYRQALLEHPLLAVFGPLLAITGVVLLTWGMLGLLVLTSRRSPVASRIAVAALLVHALAFAADMGSVLTLNVMGVESGAAIPQQLVDTLAGDTGALRWIGLLYLVGWIVGIISLVVALFRSMLTPWWVPTALAVAFAADFGGLHFAVMDFQLLLLVFAAGGALAAAHTPASAWHREADLSAPNS